METIKAIATQNGITLAAGDTVVDFRGDAHIFKQVTRVKTPGKTAKILTDNGEFYDSVFPELMVISLDSIDTCKCCNTILFEIDPENICMDCVDMECKVKD